MRRKIKERRSGERRRLETDSLKSVKKKKKILKHMWRERGVFEESTEINE